MLRYSHVLIMQKQERRWRERWKAFCVVCAHGSLSSTWAHSRKMEKRSKPLRHMPRGFENSDCPLSCLDAIWLRLLCSSLNAKSNDGEFGLTRFPQLTWKRDVCIITTGRQYRALIMGAAGASGRDGCSRHPFVPFVPFNRSGFRATVAAGVKNFFRGFNFYGVRSRWAFKSFFWTKSMLWLCPIL